MLKFIQSRKAAVIIGSVIAAVLLFAHIAYTPAVKFLVQVSGENMESLGIVTLLDLTSSTLSSVKIPLLSGAMTEGKDVLNKVTNFLLVTNSLILLKITLLNLSQSLVFKIALVSVFLLTFYKPVQSTAVKIVVILLYLNPGLSFYVVGLQYTANQMNLELGSGFNDTLTAIHQNYQQKEQQLEDNVQAQDSTGHESFLKREAKKVEAAVEKAGLKISEDFSEAKAGLKNFPKKLVQMVVNLIVNVVMVFLILPLLYFYIFYQLLKNLFSFHLSTALETKIENQVK